VNEVSLVFSGLVANQRALRCGLAELLRIYLPRTSQNSNLTYLHRIQVRMLVLVSYISWN